MLQKSLYWVNVCRLLQSTSLVLWERIFEMDNNSLEQFVDRILLLKYWYMGSFPSDFAPNLPNDTFAIINTQPSNTPGEHWIMIAKFHHGLFFGRFSWSIHQQLPFSKAELQPNGSNKTTRSSQCMRFLHNLCIISFFQVSTRGDNWCS